MHELLLLLIFRWLRWSVTLPKIPGQIASCYHMKEVFPQVAHFLLPEHHEQFVSRW